MDHPPAPLGWNKTIKDLVSEQKFVGYPEIEWARQYERSLLPADTRFPRHGDLYEAIDDVELDYLTQWRAPYTGGGTATLKRGERVLVGSADDPAPLGVYAAPQNYKEVESRIIPEAERTHYKYDGFSFWISTRDLNAKFRLVAEGHGK